MKQAPVITDAAVLEETVKQLKQSKTTLKGRLTRQKHFIESFQQTACVQNVFELEARLPFLNDIHQSFIDNNQFLIAYDTKEKEGYEKELELFESDLFFVKGEFLKLLDTHKKKDTTPPIVVLKSETGENLSFNQCNHKAQSSRLPEMKLPKFDGKIEHWLQFQEMFETLVINQEPPLSAALKIQYLLGSIPDEFARNFEKINYSEEGFEVIWKELKNRFDNKVVLIDRHLSELFKQKTIHKDSSDDLRKLIDNFTSNLNQLKLLGQEVEKWDMFIIHLIKFRLDEDLRRVWDQKVLEMRNSKPTENNAQQAPNNPDGEKALPTWKQMKAFLEGQCQVFEQNQFKRRTVTVKTEPKSNTKSVKTFHTTQNDPQQSAKCVVCQGDHKTFKCPEFEKFKTPQERLAKINELRLCHNCLRKGHNKSECRNQNVCFHCKEKHHSIICFKAPKARGDENEKSTEDKKPIITSNCSWYNSGNKQVFLSTAIINIEDRYGNIHKCRALLDSGSQSCFISKKLATELQVDKIPSNVMVLGLNQNPVNVDKALITNICSRVSGYRESMLFLIVSEITDVIPSQKIFVDPKIEIPAKYVDNLADPFFNIPAKIDVIIGAEYFYEIMKDSIYQVEKTNMKLKESSLGWIVTGTHPNTITSNVVQCNMSTLTDLHKEVSRFLEIESCEPTKKRLTEEEEYCKELFDRTTFQNEEGRFVVTLPLKPNVSDLASNEVCATKRFLLMEKKLMQDTQKRELYTEFMDQYEKLGHMVEDDGDDPDELQHFLPHHYVLKPSSTTTVLRVVFDASAKSESGLSLNDTMYTGFVVQDDLSTQSIKSRKYKILIVGDLEKMYRQILVKTEHQKLQKIKWRKSPKLPIKNYKLKTVTYGTAAAAFLSTNCLIKLALSFMRLLPEAATAILKDLFVDDLSTGCDTVSKAIKLLHNILFILSSAGFRLRKLVSNRPEIFQDVDPEDLAEVDPNKLPRTLGTVWNPIKDVYSLNLKEFDTAKSVTKRIVLSESIQIFDPSGEFNPIVVRSKIFMQSLWTLKIDWDTTLPEDMVKEWNQYREEFATISQIEIPRFILIDNCKDIQLHGFCDASEKAYGACIYLRSTDGQEFKSRLLFAKSRLAPLQKQSLARLELCGAELLAKIYLKVNEVMDLKFTKKFFWSDSSIALSWIATPSHRLNTYVANRVSTIQSLTKDGVWRHIRGSQNPADILSRGCSPNELIKSELWWKGAKFLESPEEDWPEDSFRIIQELPELKPIRVSSFHVKIESNFIDDYIRDCSTTRYIQRTVAYCLRFISNCRIKVQKSKSQDSNSVSAESQVVKIGVVGVAELQKAMEVIIRHVQQTEFAEDYNQLLSGKEIDPKSRLKSLTPFIDKDGLLRVGGRLKNSDYSFSFKHQILLPDSRFTTLLLQDLHEEGLHVGQKSLLSLIRHRYWPLRARDKIRKICRSCIKCFKVKPCEIQQFMGQLPKDRTALIHPFLHVGVDFAGPITIKSGTARNSPGRKAYISVFVCLAVKAIHLELVSELTTDAFIAAIDRFFSTRGLSNRVYSDNGSNFNGAAREFRELEELQLSTEFRDQVQNHCAQKFVQWSFIPPRAPQFGGLWESSVKLVKYHLKRVLGEALLTYEEYNTVLKKVEAMLNSRPLTPESDDPTDLRVLTPGHFLIGRPLICKPEADVSELPMYRLTRFRRLQAFSQQIWKRFSDEYIHQLQQKVKNYKKIAEIKVGDMVMVKDESPLVLKWSVGRVVKLYPGKDDVVRVVDVKTANGIYRRSLSKIAKLPMETEYGNGVVSSSAAGEDVVVVEREEETNI